LSSKRNKNSAPVKHHGLSRNEKIAIPIIIIVVLWVGYSLTQPSPASTKLQVTYSSTASLTNANSAPDFTLPVVDSEGLTGQTVSLSSFQGKVVLLEFMEPWCPHCQHMASVLDSLYAQYGSGNVVFLSVAGPWNGATAGDTANFIQNYGTNWIYVYDSSGTVFSSYGINATPTFFVIGKDGSISTSFQGEQSSDALSAAISAAASS
jgi:cytochrome c-type biogenesis protein